MASIFSLFGNIFIDNEKANKSIDETTKKGKESSKSFGESFADISKKAVQIGTAVVGATTVAIGGLTAMATKVSNNADEIDKMSQRLGMSREGYQEWDYVLSQAGVDINSIQTGMKSLVKNMDAVTEGNKTATQNFEKLGISVYDSTGKLKNQEEMFNDTVLALQKMEDGTEKARLAQEVFGKQGQEMLPLLNGEAGSVEELKQKAHELGMVLNDETVDAGVSFKDTMDTLKRAGEGLFNSIAGSLMPIVEDFANMIINAMPTIQSLLKPLAPMLTNLFKSLLPPLMDLIKAIMPILIDLINQLIPFVAKILETILPVLIQLIELLLPPLMQIVEAILPLLISLLEPILPLLQPILNLLQPFIDLLMVLLKPLIELINMILPPIIELLTSIIQGVLPPLQETLNKTASILTNVFGSAFNALKPIIESYKNYLNGIITFIKGVFTGNWKQAWEGIKQIFSSIVSTFSNIFKAPLNFMIDGMNTFIKSLNKIKIPDWVPAVGGKGINLPLLKKLRVGIDYVPYDEMQAVLHKGERVLTAEENRKYVEKQNERKTDNNIIYNNSITIEKLEVREENDIKQIAEELYYLQKKEVIG